MYANQGTRFTMVALIATCFNYGQCRRKTASTRFYLLSRAHQTDFCLVSTQIQLSQAAYGFMITTARSGNSTTINVRAQV